MRESLRSYHLIGQRFVSAQGSSARCSQSSECCSPSVLSSNAPSKRCSRCSTIDLRRRNCDGKAIQKCLNLLGTRRTVGTSRLSRGYGVPCQDGLLGTGNSPHALVSMPAPDSLGGFARP